VMPATSMGYVFLALAARFFLHEHVSVMRWLGIVLITGGVGFVAGGPELTVHGESKPPLLNEKELAKSGEFRSTEERVGAVSGGTKR
jgi:hypothetical protein